MEYIKNIGIKNYWRGATQCPWGTRARHTPQACHRTSWGPRGSVWPNSNAINSLSRRKNRRGSFITFHDTEPLPPPVLHRETRSGVRSGLRRRGSSGIVITNPSSSLISWCSPPGVSNSFVGLLVGEELDEIHHVIELVLLGLDP